MKVSRDQVLRYRIHAQQLDRNMDSAHDDTDILDLGVQDTGNQGSSWALALRGVRFDPKDHFIAWTLRGALMAYRRSEAAEVAAATAPYDEADAAKRVFDASKPLKAAGIPVLDALSVVAKQLHRIVTEPTVKGEVSGQLSRVLGDPYLRYCGPCQTIHGYEQTFRLAALPAGLELEPDTSPPVLRRIPGWAAPAAGASAHLDPIRACLHLLGPLTPKLVAEFIDAPVKTVVQHWPTDVEEVDVVGIAKGSVDKGSVDKGSERRHIIAADAPMLADVPAGAGMSVRLLGSHDLFLQARDRGLLVADESQSKRLWPVLGRPGAILRGHDIVGTWRPRSTGSKLAIAVETWTDVADRELADQAARLAAHRGQTFSKLS